MNSRQYLWKCHPRNTQICVNELHIARDYVHSAFFFKCRFVYVNCCLLPSRFALFHSNGFSAIFCECFFSWKKKIKTWLNPCGMCEYYNRVICYAGPCENVCARAINFRPILKSRLLIISIDRLLTPFPLIVFTSLIRNNVIKNIKWCNIFIGGCCCCWKRGRKTARQQYNTRFRKCSINRSKLATKLAINVQCNGIHAQHTHFIWVSWEICDQLRMLSRVSVLKAKINDDEIIIAAFDRNIGGR